MTRAEIDQLADEAGYEGVLIPHGLEGAFVGFTCQQPTREVCAVFDYNKCIKILVKEMTEEEAIEHFDYNVAGAFHGVQTPIFIQKR